MSRFAAVPMVTLVVSVVGAAAMAACTTTANVETSAPITGEVPANATRALEGLAPDWRSKAAAYLNERAASWLSAPPPVANIKCALSCHTTFPYLLARAALGMPAATGIAADVRTRIASRVAEHAHGTAIPMYGKNQDTKSRESHATEAVLNAAALVLDDLGAGGALSTQGKAAFEGMWKEQRADGAWEWLDFGLEPWETRADWGMAIAALVSGSIPEGTSSMQAVGTAKLIGYLKGRMKTMALHDRITVLWASSKLTTLLDTAQQIAIADELSATQCNDGGFSLRTWAKVEVAGAGATTSDGYATALAALALCTGVPEGRKRADVLKALAWIAKNQQSDGSWPGQSVNSESDRSRVFMTDAATAYAAIAISTCAPDVK